VDYKCSFKCPVNAHDQPPPCCRKCVKARAYFVTEKNEHLWDDEYGFWSKVGCRLGREDMPKECKAYDCRNLMWDVRLRYSWEKEIWEVYLVSEINDDLELVIMKKARRNYILPLVVRFIELCCELLDREPDAMKDMLEKFNEIDTKIEKET
jgi:hypothetical protein